MYSDILIQYAKGGLSGMCGILISHPIDTIKTHIQSGKSLNQFSFTIRNLYKGINAPLIGVGFEKAIVFGTYNFLNKNMNLPIYLAGAGSGLAASLIVTPYERIKILKQNNSTLTYKNYIDFKFLFQGLSATFTREVPGFAIYFSVYEYLKYRNHTRYNQSIDYVSSFVYGGVSGTVAWIFIYPQDRVKTLLQSENYGFRPSIKSIIHKIYSNGGLKMFYKGFSWAVYRAILLHSGTFCAMEILSSYKIDVL
jgi:solute carrier family 25 carnitine/acylcarnitine transporter 20/29